MYLPRRQTGNIFRSMNSFVLRHPNKRKSTSVLRFICTFLQGWGHNVYIHSVLGMYCHPVHPCPGVYIHPFQGLYALYTLSLVYIHPVLGLCTVLPVSVHPCPRVYIHPFLGFYTLYSLSLVYICTLL